MSRPIDLTVIRTRRNNNGVLMGIFIDTAGECQYPNGRLTSPTDEKAWWAVPDFTKAQGVCEAGYYYVLTRRGYERRSTMYRLPEGGVAFGD